MTDLSALSDDELMAMYTQGAPAASAPRGLRNNNPLNLEATVNWTGMQGNDGRFAVFPDIETGVEAADRNLQTYATKHGLSTVAGVINRWAPPSENDSRAYAQTVAQKLGVSPDDPLDMTDPQVRRAMLDAMADVENGQDVDLGAAMPTQQAQDLSGMSDDELMALYTQSAPAASRKPAQPPRRQVAAAPAPTAPRRPAPAPAPVAARSDPTIAQDVASGLWQPFKNLGDTVAAGLERSRARAAAGPPRLQDAPREFAEGMLGTAGLVGDVLGLTSAPVQGAVRPIARAVNRATAALPMAGQSPGFGQAPQLVTDPNARQAVLEGAINQALSAATAPKGRVPSVRPQQAKPMNLDALKAASDQAWARVDASGYRFPQSDVRSMAGDIRKLVDDAGPELYPDASRIANRIEELSKRGDLTPAQANRLRSQVGEKLLQPGSTEASLGGAIKARIDGLIDTANNADLAQARDLYTRLVKMREVEARLGSAELAQETAGTGGNQNAPRQKLKPLIDPKSGQRIRNLTPDETQAIRKVTKGTPAQNLMRLATALDPTAGKLQALLSAGASGATGGQSLWLAPVGMAAKQAERAMGAKSVQDLLDLISTGGVKPKPIAAPAVSYSGPMPTLGPTSGSGVVPILSVRGGIGSGVVAAPLTRTPSGQAAKRSGKTERSSPPRKRK